MPGHYAELEDLFPVLESEAWCPVCNRHNTMLWIVIWLNDEHRWTREAIADWLDTQEAA